MDIGMKEDLRIIRDALLKLSDTQQHLANTGKLPKGYSKLIDIFHPMNQDQIYDLMKFENKGPLKTDFLTSDFFLYLPPLCNDSKVVPIFSLFCDLDESPTKISFYIFVFRYPEEEDGGVDKSPNYLGFRFEGSHATKEMESEHDYWHVQIVNKFKGKHESKFPKCHNWLPVRMPCIPIKAESPVSLFISLLFSFYGNQIFNKIDFSFKDQYKKPLDGILRIEKKKTRRH